MRFHLKNVDYVIALTHMRTPNDLNLMKHVSGIDIFLGGHDHHYESEFVSELTAIILRFSFRIEIVC